MKKHRIPIVLLASSCFCLCQAGAANVQFSDFSDLSDFTLNGATAGINAAQVIGSLGTPVLRLTNDFTQSGGAFLTDPISLDENASFSSAFSFQISNPRSGGADGIVFVVQTNSADSGGEGGGIGYSGIPNSLGVEFDNWDNGASDANNANHVGINLDGSTASDPLAPVGTPFDDGDIWHSWVDYNGLTGTLEVRLSLSNARPADPLLSKMVDLPDVLGQTDAFIGFTSGTGGAAADHDILSWEFRSEFNPIGASVPDGGAAFGLLLLGLLSLGVCRRYADSRSA